MRHLLTILEPEILLKVYVETLVILFFQNVLKELFSYTWVL